MDASVWLVGCTILLGQPVNGPDWQITPRLGRGQELFYRGTFEEEATGRSVRFTRAYRTETRVFILETPAQGLDVALLTVLKQQNTSGKGDATLPTSVRLEVA